MLHAVHASLDIHEQRDLVPHNIIKNYLYVGIVSFAPWGVWILYDQFTWGRLLVRLPKARLALQMEFLCVLLMVQNSFVLSTWISGASFVDIQKAYCHTKQLMQWFDLMLKSLVRWVTSFSHHLITWIKINLLKGHFN